MKQRLITSFVGLALFFTIVYFLPQEATIVAFSIVCAIATYEVVCANAMLKQHKSFTLLSAAFGAAVPAMSVILGLQGLVTVLVLYTCFLIGFALITKTRFTLGGVALCYVGVFVVTFFLSSILRIFMQAENGSFYILLPFGAAWLTDVLAMQGGMRFGKHKLCPKISPKKTVEGSICGLIGGSLGLVLLGVIFPQIEISYGMLALIGLGGSIISQIGDLSMSVVKRVNGIKDFGSIMPGHGGILDRFDSVMLAAPFMELVLRSMGIL